MLVLGFIIPFALICYCYERIMAKVKRTEKRALGETIGGYHKRPTWGKGRKLMQLFVGVITEPLTGYGGVKREG